MIPVKITLSEGARLPSYQTRGASGADLHALLQTPLTIEPGAVVLVPTGLFIELPDGYEAQIRPRSGLALKHGITLLNTPGTIDSDYRGEIKIIMVNHGRDPFIVEDGMRIAQMVFARTFRADFEIACELTGTERNEGGFGHSGV
jgi:dUTP pyrophosphatase